VVGELAEAFERTDRLFSLYREDSELSRIADGRLAMTRASEEVRDAYAAAVAWMHLTDAVPADRYERPIDSP
ncbi:hypothetical protein ACC691_40895, partial [Rhizobium johnstonii]|uniref:hypothetical protein n=1 Tax=Rhizobium johnstonii TaxID=3019933 RepID=UPI003F9A9BD5